MTTAPRRRHATAGAPNPHAAANEVTIRRATPVDALTVHSLVLWTPHPYRHLLVASAPTRVDR
jgi:hypothetical protein